MTSRSPFRLPIRPHRAAPSAESKTRCLRTVRGISPGSWADLQKSNGAFAAGLNAQARLVAPALGPDQYSEITYSQDPGAASWVGVTTRTQSAANGSGYLAIVYAGEVRLYRADDSGSLNFTLLASAAANIGTAPRRLRFAV